MNYSKIKQLNIKNKFVLSARSHLFEDNVTTKTQYFENDAQKSAWKPADPLYHSLTCPPLHKSNKIITTLHPPSKMGCKPLQGYRPQHKIRPCTKQMGGERHSERKLSCLKTQRSVPAEARTRTTRSGVQRNNH